MKKQKHFRQGTRKGTRRDVYKAASGNITIQGAGMKRFSRDQSLMEASQPGLFAKKSRKSGDAGLQGTTMQKKLLKGGEVRPEVRKKGESTRYDEDD